MSSKIIFALHKALENSSLGWLKYIIRSSRHEKLFLYRIIRLQDVSFYKEHGFVSYSALPASERAWIHGLMDLQDDENSDLYVSVFFSKMKNEKQARLALPFNVELISVVIVKLFRDSLYNRIQFLEFLNCVPCPRILKSTDWLLSKRFQAQTPVYTELVQLLNLKAKYTTQRQDNYCLAFMCLAGPI